MGDPFIGEIRLFAGNFAPQGWAFCNGQVLNIAQNTALFAVLGTMYGGDGKTTFALPNLQDRAPMHWGQGPGLTNRPLAQPGGYAEVTLTEGQIASHTHGVACDPASGTQSTPDGRVWAATPMAGRGQPGPSLYTAAAAAPMSQQALAPVGEGRPHPNLQPHLGIYYIIALQGIFPPRS